MEAHFSKVINILLQAIANHRPDLNFQSMRNQEQLYQFTVSSIVIRIISIIDIN